MNKVGMWPVFLLLVSAGGGIWAFVSGDTWFADEPATPAQEVCFPCQYKWKMYKKTEGANVKAFSGYVYFSDFRPTSVKFTLYANSPSNRELRPMVYYSGSYDGGTLYHVADDADYEGTWTNLRYRRELNVMTLQVQYADSDHYNDLWIKEPSRK